MGEALLRMAMMYRRLGGLDDFVTMTMQAMETAKLSDNPIALAFAHQGLAVSFDQSARYAEAREQYLQMRDRAHTARSAILDIYAVRGLAGVTDKMGNVTEAERLMREAIAMSRALYAPFNLAHALFGLADMFRRQGRHADARPLLDEIAAIYARYPNKIGEWWTLDARSMNAQALGRLSAARADAQRAYALANEIGVPLYKGESAKRMAAIMAAIGNHRRAYQLAVEATLMADKSASERVSARMVELGRRYETESRRREIGELTHRNEEQAADLRQQALQARWLWTLLIGSVAAFAGTAYFLYRLSRSQYLLMALNAQVQQSESKLQATLNAMPELLFEVGLDGRYHDIHPADSPLLVEPAEVLKGKTVSDVMSPEAASVCLSALREAHETGTSFGKQLELVLPHGTFWFEQSVARKQVAPGQEPRFIALSRDITGRKQVDAALREREQRYRGIFDNVADTLYLLEVTPDGRYRNLEVNPAFEKSSGMSGADLIGKFIEETMPPETAQAVIAKYDRCVASGVPLDEEISLDLPAGFRQYHSTLVPVRDGSGRIHRIVGISRDITERRRMERELEASQLLLRQLATRNEADREDERKHLTREIHDELGQYLLALRLGISVVQVQHGAGNAGLQEKMQTLSEMVASITGVVRNVVSSLRPVALDMGLVPALKWLVREYAARTHLQFELDVSAEDAQLDDTCATAIFRIVQESLTNIVRHAQADQVAITWARQEGRYLLRIQDNGRGFDPGMRKEKSFGLVSIRERVLMLGGEVDIASAPGCATAITVRIPVHEALGVS